MTEIFLKIVNLSFSASWLVLAVIAARFALKKAPKWINVLLWGLVAVRLLCPFSIESALSLIPSAEVVTPQLMTDPTPTVHTGIDPVNTVVNEAIAEAFTPTAEYSANPLQVWIPILSVLWVLGAAAMGEYTLFTYLRLRKQVKLAIRVNANVYLSENIPSPFVLGVFKPRIYLPYGMTERDMFHVIAHERTHIRRKDHWWKPLGFALLSIHWFNPLMWAAYILLCRDIELACDEKVIKELGFEQRADYSQALLNCSVTHRSIAACPVAFGEVGVKERVKNVLSYKKPAFWVIVIAVILCVIVAVCFLTDPETNLIDSIVNQDGYRILFQTENTMEMSIPKRDYPEECYTAEGHTFRKGQYTIGSHFGSTIYLKHLGYSDESEEYLRFTFGIDYDPTGDVVFVPYKVETQDGATTGRQDTLSVDGGIIWADEGGFDLACYPGWDGESVEFHVDIRSDVWEFAQSGVYFTISGFHKLTFAKKPVFADVTPRPITHGMTVEDIEYAQATFWGDNQQHILLNETQIGELVGILYALPEKDFEPAVFPVNTISLMLNCGDREILLKTNGSYVWFTFDSETAANIDGDWMTADEDLIQFLTTLDRGTDSDSFYGVTLTVEEVTPNGATVVFTGAGEKPEGRLLGGNDYWVQMEQDGGWVDITKVPEPSFTTESYDVDNIRRHKIDWQWRYGTLPSGHYRIGKQVTWMKDSENTETCTVWAEFTLSDPAYDLCAILANLIPDGARAEAAYAAGGGYNCFPDEAESLVQILNDIDASECMVSPGMTPTLTITVYASETVTLRYNGIFVEFVFEEDDGTLWAANNSALNAFCEKINAYSPENSTYEIYNVAPLEDIPDTYTLEEATIDKVVIFIDGYVSANQDVWTDFIDQISHGSPSTVRLMFYSFPQESVAGGKLIYDLAYDGSVYTLTSVEGRTTYIQTYSYLRFITGTSESANGNYRYEYYVLTDSATATDAELYEEITEGIHTEPFIRYRIIFMNMVYTPKQPGIPSAVKAELRLKGLPLVTVTDAQRVYDIWYMMSQAEYLGYEPKTYNLGTDLVLTDEDGSVTKLELDLDNDLFCFNGKFYDYGPGTNSNGAVNALPKLWGYLCIEDWPSEVKQAYPSFFAETASTQPLTNTLVPSEEYWQEAYLSLFYTDGSQLGFGSPMTLPILETLLYEAPNPTEEEFPGFADCVYTASIDFPNYQQINIGYVGQNDFFIERMGPGQVYTFSSEALRLAFQDAINEVRNDETSIWYAG